MNWIVVVLVILTIVFIRRESKSPPTLLSNLDTKLRKIVEETGYSTKYRLVEHPSSSYTMGKQDIHICTSCISSEDKLIYVGLHEIAHTICKTSRGKHSHDSRWNDVFSDLLRTAAKLGYLDAERLEL
uniref:WLM domain-containing protein n=1 Tax=viral metagenome TaxID=1070528 RepID=A0A6C0CH66_9ZZZZ